MIMIIIIRKFIYIPGETFFHVIAALLKGLGHGIRKGVGSFQDLVRSVIVRSHSILTSKVKEIDEEKQQWEFYH